MTDLDLDQNERRVAERLLEDNPDMTAPEFAGRFNSYLNDADMQTAVAIYNQITRGGDSEPQADDEADESDAVNDDPDTEGSDTTPAEHYRQLAETGLYDDLGTIERSLFSLANQDRRGWYRDRDAVGDADAEGRPWALGNDFNDMLDDLDRTIYASINYQPASWFMDSWQRFEWDDGERNWVDDGPTPEYGELACIAPFADIDLEDDVKHERPEGDIPQADVEDALGLYIDAFAELAGGHEHVFALDSVGGAYVMVAPTATMPIAKQFETDDRELILDELTDRMNRWLVDTRETVNQSVPAVEGVFEPDEVNNKNRLYKAPISVHSSLDGVVTALDATAEGEPDYEFTPIEAVDSELMTETSEWVAGFTDDHKEAVEPIVAGLWPDEYAEADGWVEALKQWLDDERAEPDGSETVSLQPDDIPDDLDSTDEFDVVKSAIENINVKDLARSVVDDFDTDPGRDPPRFNPSWRTSSTGESCYADRDKFVDLKEGKNGGGPIKLIARDRGIISHCRHSLEGGDFWKAVNALREEGYHIPYFEGSDGKHDDVLRLYEPAEDKADAQQKAMRELFK